MSIIKPRRSGGVIGTIGPIGGSGVFSLRERHALSVDNYDDVSLYLKMNGASGSTTFYDSSQYGHTVTANGNAQISTAQSKFGGASGAFDGTGDYLSVPDDAAFAFGAGDFTIEGWFYLNAIPSSSDGMVLLGQWATGGTFSFILQVFNDASQLQMLASYSADGSSIAQNDTANITVSTSQWYHFAISRTAGVSRQYLNGVQVGSFSNSVNLFNSATSLNIGRHGANIRYFNGYIDDLRITKGMARYTGNFTPPAQAFPDFANPSLLLHMDGADGSTTFIDSSPNGHTVTANGNAQISTAASKFGGASAAFDGTGDYLTLAGSSIVLADDDFTIECWIYPLDVRTFSLYDSRTNETSPNGNGFVIGTTSTQLWVVYQAGNKILGPTVVANQWTHVAVTRSANSIKMFLNGSQVGATWTTATSFTDGETLIGTDYPKNARFFNGYIDDLRITKGVALYGSFQPPAQAFADSAAGDPDFADVSLLLHMDGADGSTTFTDSSSNAHTVTANGNAQISTAASKFGGASAAFDGTGDYLTLGGEAAFAFGAGDFTIEMWVYFNTISGDGFLYDSRGPSGLYPAIYRNGSVIRYFTNSANRIASGTVAANQWYHVAVVRSGGTTALFLNGSQQGTYADTNTYLNDALRPIIGAAGQSGFVGVSSLNGYIDDLRITKGVARYGSFTPPAQAFPDSAAGDPDFADVSLLLHMDGTNGSTAFVDSSKHRHTVTANGNAQISTAVSKFGGASAAFDGTGDYLTVANDASLQLTNNVAWTLEFWFYANALAAQQHLLHRYLVTSPYNGFGFAFGSGGAATTTLRFWDGATWRDIETSVATGQWRHVAVSYEGSGSTARMFLDGIAKGAAFAPSASIANTTNNLGIGAQYDGSLPFNGYIDDLRITKGVARYTGNFTPPQREFLP